MRRMNTLLAVGFAAAIAMMAASATPTFAAGSGDGKPTKTEKKAAHQKAKAEKPKSDSMMGQDTTPAQRTPIGY